VNLDIVGDTSFANGLDVSGDAGFFANAQMHGLLGVTSHATFNVNATVKGTLFTEGNLVMNLHTRANANPAIASKQLKMVVEPFNTLMSHNEISTDETDPSSDIDGIRMKFQEHHPDGTITGSFIAYQGMDHGGTKNGLSLGGYHKTSAGVDNMYPHMKLYSDTSPSNPTVKIFVPTVFGDIVDFSKDGEQVAWKTLDSPSGGTSNGVTSNGTLKVVKKLHITGDFPVSPYLSYTIRGGDNGLTTSNRILSAIVWSSSNTNSVVSAQNTHCYDVTFATGSGGTSRDLTIKFDASRQGQPFSCYIDYY
jgi:hypothetical protein